MKNFWKNKNVIVTGATGFVGSYMVKMLMARGSRVTAAVSLRTTDKRIKKVFGESVSKIHVKKVNLLDVQDCLKITRKQDIVLNFAAMDGGLEFKKKYPAQIFQTNTQIVLNMLEASVKNKIDRFLLMSSIEVYPKNATTPIKEEYSLEENFTEDTNGYVWSKRFSEIAAKMYSNEYGLKIAIARPGNIYGPGDDTGIKKGRAIPTFIQRVLDGKKIDLFGGGVQKKQFLYITDLIEALLSLVEKYPTCDPVAIGGTQTITVKHLAEVIQSIAQEKPVAPIKKSSSSELVFSIAKAKRHIGFNPTKDLIEGLKETYDFFNKS